MISILCTLVCSGVFAQGPTAERFRREAPEGWKALSRAVLNRRGILTIDGEAIEGYDKSGGGRQIQPFAFSAGESMLHYTLEPRSKSTPRREFLYGINRDYSFRIDR